MVRNRLFSAIGFVLLLMVVTFYGDSVSAEKEKNTLGIYLYENIEGYHTVSSTANARFAANFLPDFARITTCDRVPLESNETVRILDEMTKDRKVVVTTLTTWMTGNVISAPTVTFADDAIKFKDLTWHIDQNALLQDAKDKKLDQVLMGSFSGMVRKTDGDESKSSKNLISVTVVSNMNLFDLRENSIVWSGSYTEVAAGFDPRVAFNDAVIRICDIAAKELGNKIAD